MSEAQYKRVLIKVSGEALAADKKTGLDFDFITRVANAVKAYNKIDAGTYKKEMNIKVVSNEMDNTSNYNVNYLNRENKIIINKVTLTFVTDESSSDFNYIYSKTYDGTTLYCITVY